MRTIEPAVIHAAVLLLINNFIGAMNVRREKNLNPSFKALGLTPYAFCLKRFPNVEVNAGEAIAPSIINTDIGSVVFIHQDPESKTISRSQRIKN